MRPLPWDGETTVAGCHPSPASWRSGSRAELERRAEAGRPLSIIRLADFPGLGRGHLSEILRVDKQPTLRTVEKIATALKMDACELLCPDE